MVIPPNSWAGALCLLGRLCLWESLRLGAVSSPTNLILSSEMETGGSVLGPSTLGFSSPCCLFSSTKYSSFSLSFTRQSAPGESHSTGSLDALNLCDTASRFPSLDLVSSCKREDFSSSKVGVSLMTLYPPLSFATQSLGSCGWVDCRYRSQLSSQTGGLLHPIENKMNQELGSSGNHPATSPRSS